VVVQPHLYRDQFGVRRAPRARTRYRVRACDARSRVMPHEHHIDHGRNEAVEPHTIDIITRFLGGVVNKAMRSFCTI
jgi:hypothetical protein